MRPMHLTPAERNLAHLVTDFAMGTAQHSRNDYRTKLAASRKRLDAARKAFFGITIGKDAYYSAFQEMEAAANEHRKLMEKVFAR